MIFISAAHSFLANERIRIFCASRATHQRHFKPEDERLWEALGTRMGSDHPCEGSPERDCCELSFVSTAMLAKLTLDSSYESDLAYMADALKRRGKGSRREGM